ncbi:hypothetical protein [Gayadomonas joobiniege]|uniref:hypothetical protein n=1 Tax=Gayadomonas joobiniege TaxID=1234606 RepID=UPI00035E9304|nr:hypothetical protein [Gayadomonas joobiniege]
MTQSFDFNKALAELQSGKGLTGEDGVSTPATHPARSALNIKPIEITTNRK